MKRFIEFILYNNTVPIVFGILFLGTSVSLAANPDVQATVVDSQSVVSEVDNSLLLDATITDQTVAILIGAVTEDETNYYIEYQLGTMEVRDGVWQPATRNKTLVVNKESVVGYDLGLYAEEEIAEVHAAEVRLLQETQANERLIGQTPKIITTEYSGLVGQFFDPSEEVFPEYTPLIDPEVGVPLTREQERAHDAIRRLAEEERRRAEQPNNPQPAPNPTPVVVVTTPTPSPEPTPTTTPDTPVEDPEPEPLPEPVPEEVIPGTEPTEPPPPEPTQPEPTPTEPTPTEPAV